MAANASAAAASRHRNDRSRQESLGNRLAGTTRWSPGLRRAAHLGLVVDDVLTPLTLSTPSLTLKSPPEPREVIVAVPGVRIPGAPYNKARRTNRHGREGSKISSSLQGHAL